MRPQVYYVLVWSVSRSVQHPVVVQLCLQADGNVAFEEIFRCLACAAHDSSLYLFVLVLFLEAVKLLLFQITINIFYQNIVHVYWGVVYNHHVYLCYVQLPTF